MALVDDPPAFILRMFQMEAREGRGQFCEVFAEGAELPGLPLALRERVFGRYKGKYVFTPHSLILIENGTPYRIAWARIAACSTQHGQGAKSSVITTVDGKQITIAMRDLATGWAGRISQLLHGMIERWGATASGAGLMSPEAFLERAEDGRSFGVNLTPPPSVATLSQWFGALADHPAIRAVHVVEGDPEGETDVYADQVVIITTASPEALSMVAANMGASEVFPAPPELLKRLGQLGPAESALVFWWD